MRLGFVSARSVAVEDGVLWADAGLGRLVDRLHQRLEARGGRLTVALCQVPRRPLHNHRLALPLERLHPLPPLLSLARGLFRGGPCRRVIRALEAECDAVVVQLPFAAPAALLAPRTPRVYHVCADVLAQARTATGYGGARRLPAWVVGKAVDSVQRYLARRRDARVVTHGRALLERFGLQRGRAVVSSTLRRDEVGSVARRRPGPGAGEPFRVLFVGYLRHEKGIDVLFRAFLHLLRDVPAELVLVGEREIRDHGMAALLAEGLKEAEGRGTVTFQGPVPFGPDLFQAYADADVLALPSRNEGTPRVLVEARAFGCPVVASRVGGIPTSVEDGVDGLLVPPGDPAALASALRRLAEDGALRQRLITAGQEGARCRTVEALAEAILEEVAAVAAADGWSVPEEGKGDAIDG